MKILVIDDSQMDRRLLQHALKKAGVSEEILFAEDGQAGLDILRKFVGEVGLILLDSQTPKMDGLEFMRITRKDKAMAAIPIIMMTATWTNEHREVARLINPDLAGYIIKPFKAEELLAHIKPYLKKMKEQGDAEGRLRPIE